MRPVGGGSLRRVLGMAACIALHATLSFAQVAAGEITGLFKDQAGAAVPGATVTVTDVDTNRQRIVVVERAKASTRRRACAPGDYRIDVELAGFRPMRRDGIHLATGEKARIDFDLAVGERQRTGDRHGGRADRCAPRPRASAPSSSTSRSCSCR